MLVGKEGGKEGVVARKKASAYLITKCCRQWTHYRVSHTIVMLAKSSSRMINPLSNLLKDFSSVTHIPRKGSVLGADLLRFNIRAAKVLSAAKTCHFQLTKCIKGKKECWLYLVKNVATTVFFFFTIVLK